jgi:hypothetical protein
MALSVTIEQQKCAMLMFEVIKFDHFATKKHYLMIYTSKFVRIYDKFNYYNVEKIIVNIRNIILSLNK